MYSKITITDSVSVATIDIEGVIGVPEQIQFDDDRERVTTYAKMKEAIEKIEAIDAAEVVVNIRSTGGDVNDALLIFDAIKALKCKVTTRCYGYAASAATIIAQAASCGSREISANSLYLIHCCESSCEGNAQAIGITKELLDKSDERIAAIYAERSGLDSDGFIKLMHENGGKGRWLTPNEVIERGLADKIISSEPIENFAVELVEMLGLTPLPQNANRSSWRIKVADQLRKFADMLGLKHPADALLNQTIDVVDTSSKTTDIKSDCKVQIQSLEDRITEFSQGGKQSEARPTSTSEKEDPNIGEYVRTPNQIAYDNDLNRLIKRD